MSKKTSAKLEMVPAGEIKPSLFAVAAGDLPKGAEKLTLPPLLKPGSVPVGSMVSGEIIALAASISGRADMRESKLIHCRHASGSEFLLPLTGVIKRAIGGNEGVEKNVGNLIFVVRQPDSETTKYGGVKKVFMFDVYLKKR